MYGLCVSCGQVQQLDAVATTEETYHRIPVHAKGEKWCTGAGQRVDEGQVADRYEDVHRMVKMEEDMEIEEGAEVSNESHGDRDVPEVTDEMLAGDEWDEEEDEAEDDEEGYDDDF